MGGGADPLAHSEARPLVSPGLGMRPSDPCDAPRAPSRIQGAFREESLQQANLVFIW